MLVAHFGPLHARSIGNERPPVKIDCCHPGVGEEASGSPGVHRAGGNFPGLAALTCPSRPVSESIGPRNQSVTPPARTLSPRRLQIVPRHLGDCIGWSAGGQNFVGNQVSESVLLSHANVVPARASIIRRFDSKEANLCRTSNPSIPARSR
jgi:hypothetical protein